MDIIINENLSGRTIRDILTYELGFSSKMIKKLKFSENGINVNGKFVTVRYVLCKNDVLSLAVEDRPCDVSPYTVPVDIPIDIIFEDEFITAVNKPAGMPSHPSHGHRLDTVSNALAYKYRDKNYVFRPVNRLDRDTSGCMLTANSKAASYKMYQSMRRGEIKKDYIDAPSKLAPRKQRIGIVAIDINGIKNGKNEIAKDIFAFVMYNDGSLRPVGIYNWDGTQNDDLVWEKECDIGSEGGNPYCTGAIFENKFKVKYKY